MLITQGAPTVEAFLATQSIEDKNDVGLISLSSMPVNHEKLAETIINYEKILIIEDHYSLGAFQTWWLE